MHSLSPENPEPFHPIPLTPTTESSPAPRPLSLPPLDGLVARPAVGDEPASPPPSLPITNAVKIRFTGGPQAEAADPVNPGEPARLEDPAGDTPVPGSEEVPTAPAVDETPVPPPAGNEGGGSEPPREDPPVPTPPPEEGPERTGPPTAETLGRWQSTVQELTAEVRAQVPGQDYHWAELTKTDPTGKLSVQCIAPAQGSDIPHEILVEHTASGNKLTFNSREELKPPERDFIARSIVAAGQDLPPDQAAWLTKTAEAFAEPDKDLQAAAIAEQVATSPSPVGHYRSYEALVTGNQRGFSITWSETVPPADSPAGEPEITAMGIYAQPGDGTDYIYHQQESGIDLQIHTPDALTDPGRPMSEFVGGQSLGIAGASNADLAALDEVIQETLNHPHMVHQLAEHTMEVQEGPPTEATLTAWNNTLADLAATATGWDNLSTSLLVADAANPGLSMEVKATVRRIAGTEVFVAPEVTIRLSTSGESPAYDSQLPIDEQSRSVVAEDIERIAQNLPADQAEWLRNVHEHLERSDASQHQTPLQDLILNSPFGTNQRSLYRASGTGADGMMLRAEWEEYQTDYHDPESEPVREFTRIRLISPAGARVLYHERGDDRNLHTALPNPDSLDPGFTPDADEIQSFARARDLGLTSISNGDLIAINLHVREIIEHPETPSE